MPVSQKFDEILESAREAHHELADLEHRIQDQIDHIDDVRHENPLNDEQKNRRRQLRAAQKEVRDASDVLVYVTLRRLSKSEEIKILQKRIKQINQELIDDLSDLGDILGGFEKFQNFVKTVEEFVVGIAGRDSAGESVNKESGSTKAESKKTESKPGEGKPTSKKPSG